MLLRLRVYETVSVSSLVCDLDLCRTDDVDDWLFGGLPVARVFTVPRFPLVYTCFTGGCLLPVPVEEDEGGPRLDDDTVVLGWVMVKL